MNKVEILGWAGAGPYVNFAWSHTYKNLIMDSENKITKNAIIVSNTYTGYYSPINFLRKILNDVQRQSVFLDIKFRKLFRKDICRL